MAIARDGDSYGIMHWEDFCASCLGVGSEGGVKTGGAIARYDCTAIFGKIAFKYQKQK
jgi:hypothetical protein